MDKKPIELIKPPFPADLRDRKQLEDLKAMREVKSSMDDYWLHLAEGAH